MPRDTQNKILRVLVDQTFQRVGGSTKVAVDVRIVSSTSRNIEAEIAAGRFREDLYHRLAVVPIRVPPLAERREDIPDLVDYFMEQISQSTGLPQAQDRRRRHGRAAVARLAGQRPPAPQQRRAADDPAPAAIPTPPSPPTCCRRTSARWCRRCRTATAASSSWALPLREARELFEREYLLAQINRFGGNISRTAEFVGMERSALHRKLKALGIG